jgi:hypothetical protein
VTALRGQDAASAWPEVDQTAAAWVMHTTPEDGASFVLRDTPVLLRVSHAVEPTSITSSALRVLDPRGDVPGALRSANDGHVLIWEPLRLLVPGVEHVVIARGLRDRRGRDVAEHWSRFVACGLSSHDLRDG